jgi:hypothetical protein
VKDRFQKKDLVEGALTNVQRHTLTLESGKDTDKLWAAFDANDTDWDDAYQQVELALSQSVDRAALNKEKWVHLIEATHADPKLGEKTASLYPSTLRALTEDEQKSVREQILKGIPPAVEKAIQQKTVTAIVDAEAGLGSGEARISRTYRKPGEVVDDWLKGFEALLVDAPHSCEAPKPSEALKPCDATEKKE